MGCGTLTLKVGKSVRGAVVTGGTPLLGVGPLGAMVGEGQVLPMPGVMVAGEGEGVVWGAGVRSPGQ